MTVVIAIPDHLAKLMSGFLEDDAELAWEAEPIEPLRGVMEWAHEEKLYGNVHHLCRTTPPLAWLLARLYDSIGWPSAVDREKTNELIGKALAAVGDMY